MVIIHVHYVKYRYIDDVYFYIFIGYLLQSFNITEKQRNYSQA